MPLNYLCQLDASQIPFETTNSIEISRISRLAALGLLRAEIKPDFFGRDRNTTTPSAAVLAITPAGIEKIARIEAGLPDTAWVGL